MLWFLILCGLVATASAQTSLSRFNFTIGGGEGIGRTYVAAFSGNTYHGVAGGGLNFSRMFGMDAEYMYYDLGIRPSVSIPQSLNDPNGHLQAISLNGIVRAPLHGKLGAYGIFGLGFYRRSVSANTETLVAGSPCQPAWSRWWGIQCDTSNRVEPQQNLSSYSKDAGGFNFGGGLTYRIKHLDHTKAFVEWRYHRAYQSDAQTIVMPITLGLRW
jgi:opacity protein-like surface antigen